jgi:Tol biopolymer transport system component
MRLTGSRPGPARTGICAIAAAAIAAALIAASPASATITYEKGPNTSRPSIWVANDDGTGARRLAGGSHGGDRPVIAPDGSAVLFTARSTANPALAVVSTAGAPVRILAHDTQGDYVWSPDSNTIAATLGSVPRNERLVLIDVASGQARTVVRGEIEGMSFSPDGKRLAYARGPAGRGFPGRTDIYTVPTAGGAPTRITGGHADTQPVWGPTAIAYAHYTKAKRREDNPKSNIFLVNPDGSGSRKLTHQHAAFLLSGPTPLDWSADGTRLLAEFGGQDTSYGEGVDVATGRVHVLTHVRAVEFGLVAGGISRDGTTVIGATGGFDPGSRHNVVTVPFAGGKPKLLVRNAFAPTWTD